MKPFGLLGECAFPLAVFQVLRTNVAAVNGDDDPTCELQTARRQLDTHCPPLGYVPCMVSVRDR